MREKMTVIFTFVVKCHWVDGWVMTCVDVGMNYDWLSDSWIYILL